MSKQRGAAVIMAMLVMAMSLTLVTGIFWRQSVLARQVENQSSRAQTHWLMAGAIDWVRVILREDGRASNVDHLGEPWAVTLAETRLDADNGEAAYLSGAISDEQAKFNLNNLASAGTINESVVRQFELLLGHAGVDIRFAGLAAQRVLAGIPSAGRAASALPVRSLEDLQVIEGFGRAEIDALRPLVTVLPGTTPINVNTARAEVLACVLPGLSVSQGDKLVTGRDRAYIRDLADLWNRLGLSGVPAGNAQVSVTTQFFLLRGQITFRNARMRAQALLHRHDKQVDILWVREEPV